MRIKKRTYTDGLTEDIICKALGGDDMAEELICEHYEPYIVKLSKVPFYDNDGNLRYRIDEDIYMSLKLKLHEVILKFRAA